MSSWLISKYVRMRNKWMAKTIIYVLVVDPQHYWQDDTG